MSTAAQQDFERQATVYAKQEVDAYERSIGGPLTPVEYSRRHAFYRKKWLEGADEGPPDPPAERTWLQEALSEWTP